MAIANLRQLYVEELRDLYNAEGQNLACLQRMAEVASSDELRDTIQDHREETERQLERLEYILGKMRQPASGRKCEGMQGIIKECDQLLRSSSSNPRTRDAALIDAAQRVEHYEMAGYGSARNHARLLGDDEAARLLQRSLDEEWESDRRLTLLAESFVNRRAAGSKPA